MTSSRKTDFDMVGKNELDARAAQLKEILLQNRNQKEAALNPSPQSGHDQSSTNFLPQSNEPVLNDQKASDSTLRSGSSITSSSRLTHGVLTPVKASDEDIEALVSSILSDAAPENIGGKESSPKLPCLFPTEGHRKLVFDTACQQTTSVLAITQLKSEKRTAKDGMTLQSANVFEQERHREADLSEHGPETASLAKPSISGKGPNPPYSPEAGTEAIASSSRSSLQSTGSVLPLHKKDTMGAKVVGKGGDKTLDAINKSGFTHRSAASLAATQIESGNRVKGKAISTDDTKVRPATASESASSAHPDLSRILEHDRDLKDWLELTGYNNLEARNKRLQRSRKLAAIESEQMRIDAERRMLLEEDALDNLHGDNLHGLSAVIEAPGTSPSVVSGPAASSLSAPGQGLKEASPRTTEKRVRDDDISQPSELRISKMRRMDDQVLWHEEKLSLEARQDPYSRPASGNARYLGDGDNLAHGPSLLRSRHYYDDPRVRDFRDFPETSAARPARRSLSPCREYRPRYSHTDSMIADVPSRTRSHDMADPYDVDVHPRGPPRVSESRGSDIVRLPVPFELGGKDDTRFFIVKSYNEENVRASMIDGIWATQTQNGDAFATAFAEYKNVILFFSVNHSKAFQGYARMATAPDPVIPKPSWLKKLHWKTTAPFRVRWLSTTEVVFHRIRHITNSLNDGRPVLVGRDGQEIEAKAGRQLFEAMQERAKIQQVRPLYDERDDYSRRRSPSSSFDEHSIIRGSRDGRGYMTRG